MLAYKAWRESQLRFLVSAATLAGFSSLFLIFRSGIRQALAEPFAEFVADDIYGGGLRNLYVVFIVVLGLGGLLQESARGTAPLTLSLPVGRTRVVVTRAVVGLLEVAGLAAVPTPAVCSLAPFIHQSYPLREALHWSAQWTAGGTVLFAGAFFLSTRFGEPYTALGMSMAALFGYSILVNLPLINELPWLNVFRLMSSPTFEPPRLGVAILVATLIVTGAARATEHQDF